MAKLEIWTTPEQIKQELNKRLNFCKNARRELEREWEGNEQTVFNTRGSASNGGANVSYDNVVSAGVSDVDNSNADVGTNYVFKNLRFLHSQMSANPPSVIPRPNSNDLDDRRKADAADRLIRFGIRQYRMQEHFDMINLQTLIYGTGVAKTMWDADAGEILEFNQETDEMVMEGDFYICSTNVWNYWMDADATSPEEIKYAFERIYMPYEEACFKFGDKYHDILETFRIQQAEERGRDGSSSKSPLREMKYDVVEIYQYWEKGLPSNGMVGRFAYCTSEGDLLGEMKPNPFRFAPPVKKGQEDKKRPGRASIPFHVLTDIDLPNRVWGKSIVCYASPLQDTLNRLDSVTLDNIQAHGVARMILPEGTEVMDDSITNSPWDIVKITGNTPPYFMTPMPMPNSIPELRAMLKQSIDDMMGVNESMFGQQKRETSGFSMQYATNQGNMIRRRLFNKYVLTVESVYKAFLNIVRKYWTETRTIQVLGKEKAFEVMDIKGADIDGGFDLVVEYGASLSLDPVSRREEILTLMPLFEKAGVPPRASLQMLKLNELEGLYDRVQMAADRQREVFEEMMATQIYIHPRELADHANMLAFAYDYIMSSEYKYTTEKDKELIEAHIREREQIAAQGPAAQQQQMGAAPQAAAQQMPAGAGMTGQQAATEDLMANQPG